MKAMTCKETRREMQLEVIGWHMGLLHIDF